MVKPVEKNFPEDVLKYIKNKKKKDTDVITKVPTDFSGMSTAMEDTVFDKAKKLASVVAKTKTEENEDLVVDLERLLDANDQMSQEDKDKLQSDIDRFKNLLSIPTPRGASSPTSKVKRESNINDEFLEKLSQLVELPSSELSTKKASELSAILREAIEQQKTSMNENYNEKLSDKNYLRYKRLQQCGVEKKDILPFIKEYQKYLDKIGNARKLGNIASDKNKVINKINEAWSVVKNINPRTAQKLMDIKPDGQGKGEIFIEFIFDDASSLGGAQSFDINYDGGAYEVKCYLAENAQIRLGTEGKITRFDSYYLLFDVYRSVQKLLSLTDKQTLILEKMVEDAKNKGFILNYSGNLKQFLNDIFTSTAGIKKAEDGTVIAGPNSGTFLTRLKSGEFNIADLNSVETVFNTINMLINAIYSNNFEYAKLINKGDVYVVETNEQGEASIESIPGTNEGNIKVQLSGTPEDEKQVKSIASELRNNFNRAISSISSKDKISENKTNSNIGKDFLKELIRGISADISSKFKEHPMMLINLQCAKKLDYPGPACYGIYDQFILKSIGQSGAFIRVITNSEGNFETALANILKEPIVEEEEE